MLALTLNRKDQEARRNRVNSPEIIEFFSRRCYVIGKANCKLQC